ncbi:MAG: hypothetical protein DHS20C18_31720 [Saprospiraceae bacterium]|nr:MAG: hypothetical protein DHS20C18_31720 [Saprospiraceae bacterium]
MQVEATSITVPDIIGKIDFPAIEQSVAKLVFPSITAKCKKLFLAVIVRNDDVYPLEHYRIGSTLYIGLPLDLHQVRLLSQEEVTMLVYNKTEAYLSTITEVEERVYEEMED